MYIVVFAQCICVRDPFSFETDSLAACHRRKIRIFRAFNRGILPPLMWISLEIHIHHPPPTTWSIDIFDPQNQSFHPQNCG